MILLTIFSKMLRRIFYISILFTLNKFLFKFVILFNAIFLSMTFGQWVWLRSSPLKICFCILEFNIEDLTLSVIIIGINYMCVLTLLTPNACIL